jgi:hypothetical protein
MDSSMTENKLSVAERFALDEWLTEYPDDMTYDEIIALLNVENQWMVDDISVWYLVENNTTDQVAMFIDSTKNHFEQATADTPLL